MKYFNYSKVYGGIRTCSQWHFFIYESVNTCEYVKTCLHSDLLFLSVSKLHYRNYNSYFNLRLLLQSVISLNPVPLHNDQLQPQSEFNSKDLHFIHLNVNSFLRKMDKLRNIVKLSNAAVIGISESKLDDSILLSEITIGNYNTLCCD